MNKDRIDYLFDQIYDLGMNAGLGIPGSVEIDLEDAINEVTKLIASKDKDMDIQKAIASALVTKLEARDEKIKKYEIFKFAVLRTIVNWKKYTYYGNAEHEDMVKALQKLKDK